MSSENSALAMAGMNVGEGRVWSLQSGGGYNTLRPQGYPNFLSDAEKCRLERIAQARQLFENKHRQYFLEGGRTAFDFPEVKSNGQTRRMYLAFNVLGLITLKSVDLLFGQSPLLDCDDDRQFDALQAMARRTRLHAMLISAGITCSAEGECFLEGMIHTDGQVYLRQVDNDVIFPVGEVGPDGQYSAYTRYACRNSGSKETPLWILLETRIEAGRMFRWLWQLDRDGRKTRDLDLSLWDPAMGTKDAIVENGIPYPAIVWVPNLLGRACSDYDPALDLQDALNAKNTQVARVLQKHSDPKLAGPQTLADPQGNVPAAADFFFFRTKEEIPQYITWNAELDAAMQDRDHTLKQLLVRTETSASLLGLKDGAAPDAYKKVRLESFNSLAKAARKSVEWTASLQRLLDVAQALDNTRPGVSYVHGEASPVGVTLRDGIPTDDGEQATTIATLRAAGAMSRRRAVQVQLGDESATDAEVAAIEVEARAMAPSVFLGNEQTQGPENNAANNDTGGTQGGADV